MEERRERTGGAVEIVPASPADAGSLAGVHFRTARDAYAGFFPPGSPTWGYERVLASWERLFAEPGATVLGARDPDDGWIGSVAIRRNPERSGEAQLLRLYVLPEHWSRGVGGRLHDAAIDAAVRRDFRVIRLWVLDVNVRARGFYERRGWRLMAGEISEDAPGIVEVCYRYDL